MEFGSRRGSPPISCLYQPFLLGLRHFPSPPTFWVPPITSEEKSTVQCPDQEIACQSSPATFDLPSKEKRARL